MAEVGRVYVVDDDRMIHNVLKRLLERDDLDVQCFHSARAALGALESDPAVDVVLTDISMPEVNGFELLHQLRRLRPEIEVVMITGNAGIEAAVAAVKAGAYNFLAKPFDGETPGLVVRKALEHKRLLGKTRALEQKLKEAGGDATSLVGTGPAMRKVRQLIAAVAPVSTGVLVLGESGTGKELVARAIHGLGPRRERPFVAINCAALPESLLESELFGFVRGAFTGAERARPGIFVAADGGTVMLDEIGYAPASVQAKLLRVLHEGEVRPLGAERTTIVDVRVIAATNVNLEDAVRRGRFREDLFYRLDVLSIVLPPLRDRPEDIPALARFFLARAAAKHGRQVPELDGEALEALMGWRWPGNVRELENALERAVVLGRGGPLGVADLPEVVSAGAREGSGMGYASSRRRALAAFDRAFVEDLLAQASGNISEAARLAGLDRANFRRILKRLRG